MTELLTNPATSTTEVNSIAMTYLVPNEIEIENFNSNVRINGEAENILHTSNYSSTNLSETNNNSVQQLEINNKQNKLMYNGVAYFTMIQGDESADKETNNSVSLMSHETAVVNQSESSFTELETASTIQLNDNQNNKNSTNRIEFDLENFFAHSITVATASASVIATNAVESLSKDLNSMQQQFPDMAKQDSNFYSFNQATEDGLSCGLNNFKIFSLDTQF